MYYPVIKECINLITGISAGELEPFKVALSQIRGAPPVVLKSLFTSMSHMCQFLRKTS